MKNMIENFWSTTKSQHEFKPVNAAVCRTELLKTTRQTNTSRMWVTKENNNNVWKSVAQNIQIKLCNQIEMFLLQFEITDFIHSIIIIISVIHCGVHWKLFGNVIFILIQNFSGLNYGFPNINLMSWFH